MNTQSNIRDEDISYPIQRSGVISNHSELLIRIADLKEVKSRQEEELKITFNGLASSFNLMSLFSGRTSNEKDSPSLVQSGVSKVIGLIFEIALGQNRSVPGILSSVLVSKLANSLISKKLPSIFSGIGSLFHRRRKK